MTEQMDLCIETRDPAAKLNEFTGESLFLTKKMPPDTAALSLTLKLFDFRFQSF